MITIQISDDQSNTNPLKMIEEMSSETEKIISYLAVSSSEYSPQKTADDLKSYISKYKRILYSDISVYIFSLNSEQDFSILQANLQKLIEYADGLNNNDLMRVIIKIYDHANLATKQFLELKQSDEEYKEKFEEHMKPAKRKIERELNTQLITLVGIFTAMAFVVFGGISTLDNIFNSMKNLTILKAMIIGCVWGICMFNLIFIFMYYILKLVNHEEELNDANIVRRHVSVFIGNLLLLTILAMGLLLYYIDQKNLGNWFNSYTLHHPMRIAIGGFLLIMILFVGGAVFIHKKHDNYY